MFAVVVLDETFGCGLRKQMKFPAILNFLDGDQASKPLEELQDAPIETNWTRWIPFAVLHAPFFLLFVVGWSWPAIYLCAILYFIRMFAITGFYHRYFSHRTFQTSRAVQFVQLACSANRLYCGGVLWGVRHGFLFPSRRCRVGGRGCLVYCFWIDRVSVYD